MNIHDFKPTHWDHPQDVWSEAHRVSTLLQQNEKRTCHLHSRMVLDCSFCQKHIKELAYYTFEELCEANEIGQEFHRIEELADAGIFLNRIAEFSGIARTTPGSAYANELLHRQPPVLPFETLSLNFMVVLGLMTNSLKLRPWRKQFTYTDPKLFEDRVKTCFEAFDNMVLSVSSYSAYLNVVSQKVQVNEFRVRSQY